MSSPSRANALNVVVIVDHASITGGQAKVAIEATLGLKQAGLNPIFFAAAAPIDPRLAAAGVETICLEQNDLLGNPSKIAAAMQGVWNFTAERRLRALLASLPPERTIVHVHGWAKAVSASIAAPIRASGLPALYTLPEYFMYCPNGGWYHYQAPHACPLTPQSLRCVATHCDSRTYPRKLWRSARTAVMQRVARFPEVFSDFILISEFQNSVIRQYIPPAARVHRISNPIETQPLGPRGEAVGQDFLFVGRLSPEKGLFCFAEAARTAGVAPVFVGDGPAEAELRERYPEAKLLGWKNAAEIQTLMRAARALVFPSLWYEGQPLTVLEAQAIGLPIIVSDGCAGRDCVEDGATGYWFKSGDSGALAEKIAALKDDGLAARMSQAAYEAYWADPPTLEKHVQRVVAVYEDMLKRFSTR